jgi:pimeloyl-ACP methyl ester carboxylesterase
MQGPSEFGIAGNLANWDVSDLLKNITTPTLTIGAKYDSMDPEFMKWMSTQFPNGILFILRKRQPHVHVRRPANLFQRVDKIHKSSRQRREESGAELMAKKLFF